MKIPKLYKIFLTIFTIISGICLFIGIIEDKQILIELPLLAIAIAIEVSWIMLHIE